MCESTTRSWGSSKTREEEIIRTSRPDLLNHPQLEGIDLQGLVEAALKGGGKSEGGWRTLYASKHVEQEKKTGTRTVETITKKEFQTRRSSFQDKKNKIDTPSQENHKKSEEKKSFDAGDWKTSTNSHKTSGEGKLDHKKDESWEKCKQYFIEETDKKCRQKEEKMSEKLQQIHDMVLQMEKLSKKVSENKCEKVGTILTPQVQRKDALPSNVFNPLTLPQKTTWKSMTHDRKEVPRSNQERKEVLLSSQDPVKEKAKAAGQSSKQPPDNNISITPVQYTTATSTNLQTGKNHCLSTLKCNVQSNGPRVSHF